MAILYPDMNPTCPEHPGLKEQPDGVFTHEPDWPTTQLGDGGGYVSVNCLHCGAEGGVTLEPEEFSWPEPAKETDK
jgi:hypothetical protein